MEYYNLYYFLYEPPENSLGITGTALDDNLYPSKRTDWAADIHLMSTYVYLDEVQVREYALNKQCYLIKEIHEQTYYNIVSTKDYFQNIEIHFRPRIVFLNRIYKLSRSQ